MGLFVASMALKKRKIGQGNAGGGAAADLLNPTPQGSGDTIASVPENDFMAPERLRNREMTLGGAFQSYRKRRLPTAQTAGVPVNNSKYFGGI
jgi:hypothetical protein